MRYSLSKVTGFLLEETVSEEKTATVSQGSVTFDGFRDTLLGGSDFTDDLLRDSIRKCNRAYVTDSLFHRAVDEYSELFLEFGLESVDPEAARYLQSRLDTMSLQHGEIWQETLARAMTEMIKNGNPFLVKFRGNPGRPVKRTLYTDHPFPLSGFRLRSILDFEPVYETKGQLRKFLGWKMPGFSGSNIVPSLRTGKSVEPVGGGKVVSGVPQVRDYLAPGVDVVHIAFKKPPSRLYGFSTLATAVSDLVLLREIERNIAVLIKKNSSPLVHHKVLKPQSPLGGTQNDIAQARSLWQRVAPDGVLITSANHEIDVKGSESRALRLEGYVRHFTSRALAGMGTSTFLMGYEQANLGTAQVGKMSITQKANHYFEHFARNIEFYLFYEILWEGGFDPYEDASHRVKLTVAQMDRDSQIKWENHAADLYAKNAVTFDEMRDRLKRTRNVDRSRLYYNQVTIPLAKAAAKAKAAVSATPPGVTEPEPRKEFLDEITPLIPRQPDGVEEFIDWFANSFKLNERCAAEAAIAVRNLIDDPEAAAAYLYEVLHVDEE